MDLSLLYALLRNICGIMEHNTGWGEEPELTDRSVSANIERIRIARNQCGHSTGATLSNADFNLIWSTIRAAVVDLDLALKNGQKYEKAVDFIRHDTMDPVMDKHYRDQLSRQTAENKETQEEISQLKRHFEKNDEQVQQKMQKLDSSLQSLDKQNTFIQNKLEDTNSRISSFDNRTIPPHIKKQHQKLLESWRKDDIPFHEIHSFQDIIRKVRSQGTVTIIGGPGSGKTATVRHIALLLQTEFVIVPVSAPSDIILYGNTERKQLFTFDDVFGIFGIERGKYIKLEDYKDKILNVLGSESKILFTCRKTVYNEALVLESFILNGECIVDLEDMNNVLNELDKAQILKNHCLQNKVTLGSLDSPKVCSKVGLRMFPLLCKLFCSDKTYQSIGPRFFENPNEYIFREMGNLHKHKGIQYAALVLCMFSQNEITKDLLKKKDQGFIEKREDVFESCRVNARNSEIQDALSNMENTFTAKTKNGYSLIHDSVYEVLAYHYGNKNPDHMLQYMSSSFVAKKIKLSERSDTTTDLFIRLDKEHYPLLAERLFKDLRSLELHDVFMNDALKDDCVCDAFLDILRGRQYEEVKTLFFSKQRDTSKIVSKSRNVGNEVESKRTTECELDRQQLLMGGMLTENNSDNVRVISWIIYYGHIRVLLFLFEQIKENNESIHQILGWKPSDDKVDGGSISDLTEQTRLLTLSCYSGDLEVVKLLLQQFDAKCINNKSQYTCHMFYDHRYITPLTAACTRGHKSVVEELIRSGASIDQQDEWGITALYVAAESGHLPVVETLIEAGADCNECDLDGITPLFAAAQSGYSLVVETLIKHGSNYNKPDIYKMSPLYVASQAGHKSVVDILIKYGADCNQSDYESRTPLYVASKAGQLSIVKSLISHGADINKCDIGGKSPLSVALQHDQKSVAEILVEYCAKESSCKS